jgi:hypothetical protein
MKRQHRVLAHAALHLRAVDVHQYEAGLDILSDFAVGSSCRSRIDKKPVLIFESLQMHTHLNISLVTDKVRGTPPSITVTS